MSLNRARLDRFLAQYCHISRRSVRLLLAQKRVRVDGLIALDIDIIIDQFSVIELDGKALQEKQARYFMLHKPVGVVSATKDEQHKTVLDLLDVPQKQDLHIVGRLDLNTSGLVLLTNDSRWSQRLTLPDKKVIKRYIVTLENPLTTEYITAFSEGMYFDYEGITTQPVQLTILSKFVAQVELTEGRYHQIKRMFGRFRNRVVALHRVAIGELILDENLIVGESRKLKTNEVINIFSKNG